MRTPSRASAAAAGDPSAASPRDAEALFRTKKIAEIRSVEASTMKEIEEKKEELRQLVGTSYRDLIDSADTIVQMKSSTESISDNLDRIDAAIRSLSASADPETPKLTPNPARARVYGIACRVKYLVDTPENIWGCLDESMLWEAAGRYLRAKEVHWIITASGARGGTGVGFSAGDHTDVLAKFPLLRHQWQIVESFKGQISQRSRERLMDQGLTVGAYSDALAAAATIDDLDPKQTVGLFLESRRSWISQILFGVDMAVADSDSISTVLCYIMKIIRATLGHVGELFLQALNDLPLFYRTVLGSPPGTQLFGGIPNPEEEVARWKLHREKLESIMVTLEPDYIAHCASSWLSDCCREIFEKKIGGRRLVEIIDTGEALGRAEKLIRETLDTRDGLEGTLEQWLKSAFGSEIESVWDQIRTIILKDGKDILDDILEEVFVQRMKEIVHAGFDRLSRDVNISEVVQAIADPVRGKGLTSYLKSHSTGGVWFREPSHRKLAIGSGFKPSIDENDFQNCLNAYFGTEVSSIRDTVDSRCKMIMEDLLSFVEYHNSFLRLKELAPYLQDKCHKTISSLLQGVEHLIGQLSTSLANPKGKDCSPPPSLIVTRALFIGRLLFAFRNHSSHIPLILGSPRLWVKDTVNALTNHSQSPSSRYSKFAFESPVPFSPRGKGLDSPRSPRKSFFDSSRRQTISAAAALFPSDDNNRSKLEEITKRLRDLCIKAHSLWILWVSSELSDDLLKELEKDDSLSSGTPLKGWEVTVIRQESSEGSQEIKIELPSMPSLYITSFLFQACQEIHRIGGHVLDRLILQNLAWSLLEKMAGVYDKYLSKMDDQVPRVSANGALQILFDLRFASDVLSGGRDASSPESDPIDALKATVTKYAFRRKQTQFRPDTANDERVRKLIQILAQKRDPIDWAIEESYLWENEKQSYKRYSVLFGFLVQLNHMYMDTVQKLPTKSNTESNILRCSTVPRFKYLPISAPALASRGGHSPLFSSDDGSRSPWKGYLNGEQSPKPDMDENSSFGATTPLFKSFMTQVGSKFGESTSRLGSMLSDAQVGMFRDRSAAAMSTFGDMLPGPAAGLLSSFTVGAARSDF